MLVGKNKLASVNSKPPDWRVETVYAAKKQNLDSLELNLMER